MSIVQVFERGAHRVVEVRLRGGLVVAIGVLEVDLLQVHRLPVAGVQVPNGPRVGGDVVRNAAAALSLVPAGDCSPRHLMPCKGSKCVE